MIRTLVARLALASAALALPCSAQLPSGFVDEPVLSGWTGPIGLCFDADGRMYVWERGGVVHVVEDGHVLPEPLLDIHDEVGNWRDFGMLGFALDPAFLTNGHVYLYYVVDRHHLLHAGTPQYDPNADEYWAASIGRVTRYTADPASGFTTLLPGSRRVLLGETPGDGIPILYESHGTGSLVFGEDGTLLLASGDGASYSSIDAGSRPETYWQDALADGILRPQENVGAFRSQMVGSLSGKILRIDPETGDGLPSNPFYDPAQPHSARSRVYALGLRNPFRFTLQPGTGDPDPGAGRPGTLYVGDVGWNTWEDVHVVTEPGMNLGWPLFEGMDPQPGYAAKLTENRDAPNPLFGGGCGVPFFRFQDLLKQEQADHDPRFPNPCDPSEEIPPGTPTFMHRRPALDARHGTVPDARVPTFTGNTATVAHLGDPDCPVEGAPFNSSCAVGGVTHSGLGLGPVYGGSYFHVDFSKQWIRALRFHGRDQYLHEVLDFASVPSPVFLTEDPADGSLLYITLGGNAIRRIRYTGDGNVAPAAVVEADRAYGASPLALQLDASGSADPEGGLLTFLWSWPGGATNTKPSPLRTFTASSDAPEVQLVTLTVTDAQGAATTVEHPVYLNDTPPQVQITSFQSGMRYSTETTTVLPLEASVHDAEHGPDELSYTWQVFLHHDNHQHPEAPIHDAVASVVLSPTPCSGQFYAYRVALTVTDGIGLSTTVESWLFPDCASSTASAQIAAPAVDDLVLPNRSVTVEADVTGAVQRVELFADDVRLGTRYAPPWEAVWKPTTPGTAVLTALVVDDQGVSTSSPGRAITVATPLRVEADVASGADDAEERITGWMYVDSSDLELGFDGSQKQTVAVRVHADVPQGATIVRAWIQLVTDEVDTGLGQFTCAAQAADDAPPIVASVGNLSSRPRTAAKVAWSPAPWHYVHARGALQRTPDLAAVVQEVVDRPGWQAGNALVFLLDGFGERTAESFEGAPSLAPRLVVEYGGELANQPPQVDAGPPQQVSLGSTATLFGTAADDGLPFGTLDLLWTIDSGRGGATFGDPTEAVTTVVFDAVGTYVLRLTADDGDLSADDVVEVEVVPPTAQTFEVRVAQSGDDAEERLDEASVYIDSSDLELVDDGSRPQVVGVRFAVDVPRNVTITAAWLQFTADETDTVATALTIDAEASDDAAPIVSQPGNLVGRPRTNASAAWSPAPWTVVGESGAAQRTVDLSAIVQELVDRPGWQAGQAMLFLVSGSGERTAEAWDGVPASAPLLHVEFQ